MTAKTEGITAADIRVGGRVQGVGYRWFVRDAAERLGLVGRVENLMDGDVAVYAEGAREKIDKLVEILKEGNGHSRVDRCAINWTTTTGRLDEFQITFGRR